jgi:tRNA wybutosine-synthesizing protein 4
MAASSAPPPLPVRKDLAVQHTAEDAIGAKMSMVSAGYFDDPFLKSFVKSHKRRSPVINHGYFLRVAAFDKLVQTFLAAAKDSAQIVNLGAGHDTLYWRLERLGRAPRKFLELDLPENVSSKLAHIRASAELSGAVSVGEASEETLSSQYSLLPCDLSDIRSVEAAVHRAGLDLR